MEIIEDLPEASSILVPLSGGGLAAGIAYAAKSINQDIRVIGVSMSRGAAMKDSLVAGRPVAVEELTTLADALGGGIGLNNRFTFSMCRDLLDDVITLSEAEIASGIKYAYFVEKEVVEGSGAVAIAALLARKLHFAGPVVAVMSGRNIDMAKHLEILRE